MPKKMLAGIKVADFTQVFTGPLTTKTLADYGAEVIRIEGKTRHDSERTARPFKDDIVGLNRGGSFNQYSTGKLSIALNLTRPKGIEVAKRFVAWADIVIENFAGGTMERMGLGYEELRRVKPDIIMISSCMMGQTGPYAKLPGFGAQLTSLSGFSNIAGWPDREPPYLGTYTDYIAPHFHVLIVLAALDYRRRTGEGQYIDISQYENGIHFIAPLVLDCAVNQRVQYRTGNRHPYAAPHGAYRCRGKDRWCAIAVLTDDDWQSFCKVIGNAPWAGDTKFGTLLARKKNEDELEELIDTLKALLYLSPVWGDRVAVVGGSGGLSVAIADVFAEAGLRVPLLTQESYDKLATFFNLVGAGCRNPVDPGSNRSQLGRIL
ncbi:CoA transferase, partial [Chloroflexota bacterium]